MIRAVLGLVVMIAIVVGGAWALAYFDLLPSVEVARDWVIIIYGVVGILFFLIGLLILAGILWGVYSFRHIVRELVDENVKPTLVEVQKTAENVRGTSEFIADTAVSPVIKVASITRGLRRGLSALRGARSRRK